MASDAVLLAKAPEGPAVVQRDNGIPDAVDQPVVPREVILHEQHPALGFHRQRHRRREVA